MKTERKKVIATMSHLVRTRKAQFRAACALMRTTPSAWAKKVGTTPGYLSLILSGKVGSPRYEPAIAEYIAMHLPRPVVGTAPIVAASTVTGNGQFSPEQPVEQSA